MNTRTAIIGFILLIVAILILIGLGLPNLSRHSATSSSIPTPHSRTSSTSGVIKSGSPLEIRACVLRHGKITKVRLVFLNKGKQSITDLKILKARLDTQSPNKVSLPYRIARLFPNQMHQVEWEFSGVSSKLLKLDLEGEYKLASFGLRLGEGTFSVSALLTPCGP